MKNYTIKNSAMALEDKIILFICRGNSGRSQMAEAFFNFLYKKAKAISAGTDPDEKIHPWTIEAMKEIGIDVSQQKPRLLSNGLLKKADKIIVMESGLLKDMSPKYSPKLREWKIEKLLGKLMGQIRKIRDQIKKRVKQLIKEIE